MINDIIDGEMYPNFFSFTSIRETDGRCFVFEISDRCDHSAQFKSYIDSCSNDGIKWVGFNNLRFDYPVVHAMYNNGMNHQIAYEKTMQIIGSPNPWMHAVWDSQRLVQQIDLFLIHHFDNVARSTSLKVLEFNMRSKNIEDLPFEPGTVLTPEQMDVVVKYNIHDVMETWRFKRASESQIVFRSELSEKYNRDFTNHNDTKIGKDYFIMELEKNGIQCYYKVNNRKQPNQTIRPQLNLNEAVFPWIEFNTPEFQRIVDWYRQQSIVETKGVFKDLSCTVDGFTYDFGVGGIHGSVERELIQSSANEVIIDLDVASYYPNLAIANRVFPHHLTEKFCDIYQDVYEQRKQHSKGSPENAMLKLALNGVYGDSNNKHSPFYDPLYTMTITINGQLLLCKLAEMLTAAVPGLRMIQINTDGLTIKIPRLAQVIVKQIASDWEKLTGLTLEDAVYSRMWVRDVNNYLAEHAGGGKIKRIGAYAYERVQDNPGTRELGWHKKHSSRVIAMAAEANMIHGTPVRDFILTHSDPFDFMICAKIPRSSKLMWEREGFDPIQLQNTTRYYVSTVGGSLIKVMPPLAKKPDVWRRIGINVGWKTWITNDMDHFTVPIDYDFYIAEAEKLIII